MTRHEEVRWEGGTGTVLTGYHSQGCYILVKNHSGWTVYEDHSDGNPTRLVTFYHIAKARAYVQDRVNVLASVAGETLD